MTYTRLNPLAAGCYGCPMDTDFPPADMPSTIDGATRRTRIRTAVREAARGIDGPGAVACVVAMAVLVLGHHYARSSFFRTHFGEGLEGLSAKVGPHLYWLLASFVLDGLVAYLAVSVTPRIQPRDTGIGLGDWKFGLQATAILLGLFLPVVFIASRLPAFASHYPLCGAVRSSGTGFVLYELAFLLYFIGWEYLFRGYLLFSLERSIGRMAIFAQMMPFVIAHFGKPQLEIFGSIIAGIALGLLALRTRSMWYGVIIHFVAALSLDLFVTLLPLPG